MKYNSQVCPASEVWRDRWVGGTTRPTLSCPIPRLFHTDMTLTACSLPNLAGRICGSFRIKQVWMTWPCLEEDVSHHVWSRQAEFQEEPRPGSASKSSKFAPGLFILPKSFLFPSLKKRIINIQSRIAKIKKPKKSHRIPKSILNNMPYTSAFGWTSGWMIRGGTTLQSFNKSALDAWMDRYQHSNHGIWWNMNICTYAWKCICKLCNICKGFANIWVKGGFPY